ncbi:MAG: rhamnulokinase [Clostridiales bacterium]|jgi:rhamnulokinase|nr:rhamnulokinase [Clostridiales bacterium]
MKYYLAIDIGASSGRHIVGTLLNGAIATQEVYRFPNHADQTDGHLTWDIERLFTEVKTGIAAAFKKYPVIESLAIDTWGVDYVLLQGGKEILPAYAYRDGRTAAVIDAVHAAVPFSTLYAHTGIQFQAFNTVYQLAADKAAGRLAEADSFLMLPEYLSYRLTGVQKKEYTEATTMGLVNAKTGAFDTEITEALGFPARLFTPLSRPGEAVGALLPAVEREVGGQTLVRLCASHDTASAFEAVSSEPDALILSSGTWSLLGAKRPAAVTTEESRSGNFTNEGGVGYIRYLRNIAGMWFQTQLQKEWGLPYPEMEKLARTGAHARTFDVNDPVFSAPASMSAAIDAWYAERGYAPPKTRADILNAVYRSLAACYGATVRDIERLTDTQYRRLYIVGGGANAGYLNELTARETAKEIVALPIEATAVGNLTVQMRA